MRVLHVFNSLMPSGAEVMLSVAAPLWRTHEVECDILEKGPVGPYGWNLARRGYRIHRLNSQNPKRLPGDLWRLVRKTPFDIVHIHTEHANFWLAAAARAAGASVVRTVHAEFAFTGFLRLERRSQRRLLELMGVREVAVSQHVADNERHRFTARCEVIENWVDTARFSPWGNADRSRARARLGLSRDQRVVLTVGNCAPVKQHEVVLQAISSLPDVVYVHVGAEDRGRAEWHLAGALGVMDRVRFVGIADDVLPYLQTADIFVMPSSREGLSTAASEALCSGIPAVFRDTPGLRDLASGGAAHLFSTQEQLVAELASLTGDRLHRRRQASIDAASMHQARFDPDRGVAEYVDLYRELESRRRIQDPC